MRSAVAIVSTIAAVALVFSLGPLRGDAGQHGGAAAGGSEADGTSQADPSYVEFMRLDYPQRETYFLRLSDRDKQRLIYSHAKKWLEENKRTLSPQQAESLEKLVPLLNPLVFDSPANADVTTRMLIDLQCEMWRSDMFAALAPHRRPPGRIADLWYWSTECLWH